MNKLLFLVACVRVCVCAVVHASSRVQALCFLLKGLVVYVGGHLMSYAKYKRAHVEQVAEGMIWRLVDRPQ